MNAEPALVHQRKIQTPTDTAHNKRSVKPVPGKLVRAGRSRQPVNPLPTQHVCWQSTEAELGPRPKFMARKHGGSDELRDMVAPITAGASGAVSTIMCGTPGA